jgi:hypothetical protein
VTVDAFSTTIHACRNWRRERYAMKSEDRSCRFPDVTALRENLTCREARSISAASYLALPVCGAFSIAKIKTGRERRLPQFHRPEAAGCTGRVSRSPHDWARSAVADRRPFLSGPFHKYGDAPRAARRPPGKAREARISGIFERRATQPGPGSPTRQPRWGGGGMHRRPNATEFMKWATKTP